MNFTFTVVMMHVHYLTSIKVFSTEKEAEKALKAYLDICHENGFEATGRQLCWPYNLCRNKTHSLIQVGGAGGYLSSGSFVYSTGMSMISLDVF